jgi:hypothetical protein
MSSIVTHAELAEIVADLRAMAAAEPAVAVRDALNRLVERYSTMSNRPRPVRMAQPAHWPAVF